MNERYKRLAKPVDKLCPDDFERHPVWGFDLSMESLPGLDETAVRPYSFPRVPQTSDVLFVRADLAAASGAKIAGTLCFRFSSGMPIQVGLSLLAPYRALQHDEQGRIDTGTPVWEYTKTGYADAALFFPLQYDAPFETGAQHFTLTGTLTLSPGGHG